MLFLALDDGFWCENQEGALTWLLPEVVEWPKGVSRLLWKINWYCKSFGEERGESKER